MERPSATAICLPTPVACPYRSAGWQGRPLLLELELHSPCHDEGSLLHSVVVLEPRHHSEDPLGLLKSQEAGLAAQDKAGQPCLRG